MRQLALAVLCAASTRGVDRAVTVTGVLAAGRGQKGGSGLRWVSEVIQLIQMRQSDVHKIVPCQPRAQPIIQLFW